MENEKLFTIGTLAKITNTKVKALRYYEKIGILIPAYINPDNGYRFYSRNHLYLVEAIRICTELNIPLNEFKKYITDDGKQIQSSLLIAEGIKKANDKILEIQKKLKVLNDIQNDMNELDNIEDEICEKIIPEEDYWLIPYDGVMNTIEYFSLLANAYADIEKNKLLWSEKENVGMMLLIDEEKQTSYIFLELIKQEKNKRFENIIHLPTFSFFKKTTSLSDIKKVSDIFPDLFKKGYNKIVFMRELYTKTYKTDTPLFEIGCSLSQSTLK